MKCVWAVFWFVVGALGFLVIALLLLSAGCGGTTDETYRYINDEGAWYPVTTWESDSVLGAPMSPVFTTTSEVVRVEFRWRALDPGAFGQAEWRIGDALFFGEPDKLETQVLEVPPGDHQITFAGENAIWTISVFEYH